MIRVRFAPSPTGYLHIGGVRTALFNYLYARHQNGQFLLRIEDTDRERSKKEYEEEIISSLKWLGLDWDGEIRRQSEFAEKYRDYAYELVKKELAYEERVDGKVAVKFRIPKRQVVLRDLILGEVQFDTSLFEDLVLLKSDGYPTYHWACVIDDYEMEVTHVIRGADHLSNTPRHLLLYEALGWNPPRYAHLPLLLGADGTPLSKRHGAVSITAYRAQGYIPEGILNYLALLGWESGSKQEFFTLRDLVKNFSLKRVNKTNARFDPEKFQWLDGQHLRQLSDRDYQSRISAFFQKESELFSSDRWNRFVMLYRPRIRTMADLRDQASYCFSEVGHYDPEVKKDYLENRVLKKHLEIWHKKVSGIPHFEDYKKIEELTRKVAADGGLEAKDLIHPLRFILTGRDASPGLFELMSVLGKECCLGRVRRFFCFPE